MLRFSLLEWYINPGTDKTNIGFYVLWSELELDPYWLNTRDFLQGQL